MKKVSVVLPIYNQEKYITASLTSVLRQSYSNLEIVAVNDGSTDLSLKIISDLAAIDKRIKVVDRANGGLVDATLAGIQNSSGEYIAFLDPDDYWGEDFLANLVNNSDNADIVASGFYYDNNGKLAPFLLDETKVFVGEELNQLRKSFLYDANTGRIAPGMLLEKYDYKKIVDNLYSDIDAREDVYPQLLAGWDRSPRSGRKAIIYHGTTPETFRYAVDTVLERVKNKDPEHRIVFLNSWNEWGEGAYMEPDLKYGKGKLEALAAALHSH